MSHRTASLGLFMAALLSASFAVAEPPRPVQGPIRVMPTEASPSCDPGTRALLDAAVARSLAELTLGVPVRRYAVLPRLVQLRRYLDRGESSKDATLVCVVDLALVDDHGVLLGTTRGHATVTAGTPVDAIVAAAHAAAAAIPAAILVVERDQVGGKYTRR